MSYATFLKELRGLRGNWTVSSAGWIRNNRHECPIRAVMGSLGRQFLNFPKGVAYSIMAAADACMPLSSTYATIRRDLLKVLNLQERTGI